MMKEVGDRVTKASFLKDFEVFEKKYPFLCVNDQSSEKNLVQSICRYPSEIKENLVYIGNMINVLDKNYGQLSKLSIKTVISMSPNKFEHLEEVKDIESFHFELNEPTKPDIHFDEIITLVLAQIKEGKKTLIFDASGMLSAAIGVKLMLETNKAWSKEIAMAYIINKRYEARDMPAWLYSQILLPNQKRTKAEPMEIDQ